MMTSFKKDSYFVKLLDERESRMHDFVTREIRYEGYYQNLIISAIEHSNIGDSVYMQFVQLTSWKLLVLH